MILTKFKPMLSTWLLVKKPGVEPSSHQVQPELLNLTTKKVVIVENATTVAAMGPTTSITTATSATAAAVTWELWYDEPVPVPKMIKITIKMHKH